MFIHQLFEEQVTRTPNATAIVSEQGALSYAHLNAKANKLARHLTSLGVGSGSRIGLCCERSLEMVIGIYGILKAGATYVPMDPAYPRERLEYMAQAANLGVVVTQEHCAASLEALGSFQLIVLDQPDQRLSSQSESNPDVRVTGDDLIYIIFTSGTTGRPKGAAVYHRGFSNLLDWFVKEFGINSEDRGLLVSSPSFDLTQKNLFAPLITGGTLHLFAPGPYDVHKLAKSIRDNEITLINCTPSAFYPVVEDFGDYTTLRSLRVVFLGGEPISLPRLRDWFTNPLCSAEVANTYGPTECTDICAFHRLNRTNMDDFAFVPLGRAVTNVQMVVVNGSLERCSIGQAGELCVGGAGVGAGYINDPELTAQRFVRNPFPEICGPLIYRTGDQVQWLSEGLLEFHGRKDHQVKIRGFRIELHEIESVLNRHPLIREAIVVVTGNDGQNAPAQLKCYFTSQSEIPSSKDLREFASTQLPEHMVPAQFISLATFPLSPNGKVDRNALVALKLAPEAPVKEIAGDDLQLQIKNIWTTVLGVESVGLDDNFFDLGGDSLTLAQTHSRLQKLTSTEFPITMLFAHTTIRGLAVHFSGGNRVEMKNEELLSRAERQRQALSAGRNLRR